MTEVNNEVFCVCVKNMILNQKKADPLLLFRSNLYSNLACVYLNLMQSDAEFSFSLSLQAVLI